MKRLLELFLIGMIFAFLGCGGGGGDTAATSTQNNTPVAKTGVFLDGPVEGVAYETASYSGYTDASGSFQYKEGETVTLKIGDIEIGAATGTSTVTPVDLVEGASDETNATVTNITCFLMSIDDDGDPSNGLKITDSTKNAASGQTIDFAVDTTTFQSDSTVTSLVTTLTENNTSPQTALVSAADAQSHLNSTLLAAYAGTWNGTYTGSDMGTWTFTIDTEGNISGSYTTSDQETYSASGSVNSNGSAALGTAGFGTTSWNGTITDYSTISGTWSDWYLNMSGTFSGSKQE